VMAINDEDALPGIGIVADRLRSRLLP